MYCVKIFSVCLMAILIAVAFSNKLEKTSRIVGGRIISIDDAKFIMQLTLPGKEGFFCGGTLIAVRHVVTAAHCLDKVDYTKIVVVGGADKLNGVNGVGVVKRKVVAAFISSEYIFETNDSDAAVLKLDGDMKGDNIKPVPLSSRSLKTDDFLDIYGWGWTKEKGKLSNELRTTRVKVVKQDVCVKQHKRGEITNNMVCARDEGKDACTSDSGGPAIYKGELAAIISWGIGCGHKMNPGVYARIDQVRWVIDGALEEALISSKQGKVV